MSAEHPVTAFGQSICNATLAQRWKQAVVLSACVVVLNIFVYMIQIASPSGCELGSDTYRLALQRCKSSRVYTVHGLWPQWEGGQNCEAKRFDATSLASIQGELVEFWPSCPEFASSNQGFWKHEWDKHGSCSDLSLNSYFSTTLQLRAESVHKCFLAGETCNLCYSRDLKPTARKPDDSYTPQQLVINILLLGFIYCGVTRNSKPMLLMFSIGSAVCICKAVVMLALGAGAFYGVMLTSFERCQLNPKLKECAPGADAVAKGLGALIALTMAMFWMMCLCACRCWSAYQGFLLYQQLAEDAFIAVPHPDLPHMSAAQQQPGPGGQHHGSVEVRTGLL